MGTTTKGLSVFAKNKIRKGDFICKYEGYLCPIKEVREREHEYELKGSGSYVFEFKYKEKRWAIDATEDNKTFGRLINHSKLSPNIKPVIGTENYSKPYIYFHAIKDIEIGEELLYDYGDNSSSSKIVFPWLKE